MHVLIASTYHLSAFIGGNEQYAHQLAIGLIEAGHKVTYLAAKAVPNQSLPYTLNILPTPFLFDKPLPSTQWLWGKTLSADVFHAAGSGLPLLSLAYYMKKRASTVLTFQADSHPTSMLMKMAVAFEQTLIPKAFDAVIATTETYEVKLKQRWPNTVIRHVPLMIPPHLTVSLASKQAAQAKLKLSNKYAWLLCVAGLSSHHYYKGIDVLLNALALLPKHYRLVLIGDGDKLKYYRNLAKHLGLHSRVRFAGQNPDFYYQAADACILPSTSSSEGFGIALIEAMYHKTPTITTTAIGPAALYKSQDLSRLVPPNDAQELASVVHQEVSHPNYARINRAKAYANTFTIRNMITKTLAVYQELNNA
jgi:glycosyltransferase involved in cell wall biosynthesis